MPPAQSFRPEGSVSVYFSPGHLKKFLKHKLSARILFSRTHLLYNWFTYDDEYVGDGLNAVESILLAMRIIFMDITAVIHCQLAIKRKCMSSGLLP